MRTILVGILVCLNLFAMAQRECGSAVYHQLQQQLDPAYASRIQAFESIHNTSAPTRLMGEGAAIIRIPVVIHVLYNNSAQNISDEQIQSQLIALNRDFRRRNADTTNTPERFRSLAADVQIEFALATADPSGRPTTGIIRKSTHVAEWRTDDAIKFASSGGSNAWDSRYYLNIWVGNLRNVVGYSSQPGGQPAKDGIVIKTSVFGTINMSGPFNHGRTLVHEAGHWLGLRHIWGDTYCGDDGIGDTPNQGNFTSGCPTTFRTSCNNGTTGDMYMNYMDYTNDACLNMFTLGQKERMQSLFREGGARNLLLSSKGLNAAWNHTPEAPIDESPIDVTTRSSLYPNPATSEITIEMDASMIGQVLSFFDGRGVNVLSVKVTQPVQKISIHSLRSGIYFIRSNGNQLLSWKLVKQ